MNRYDVVIVGAGHAGAQAAIGLRNRGFQGSIALVTEEADLPYERPPLSKDYLAGEKEFERIQIRPAAFWRECAVDVLTGREIVSVDASARRVLDHKGDYFYYGKLVWAAGAQARRLSCEGASLDGVHVIRSRADVDKLRAGLDSCNEVIVIGGGYIGLEAAAALRGLNKTVTVLEALDRVLSRVACQTLSRFYEAEHRAHGVEILLSVTVESLQGDGGRVTGVELSDGRTLRADTVIVGIGVLPAVAPLKSAGAVGCDGVDVDRRCRTSVPDVYAIGDCARQQNPFADDAWIRVESVQNANAQAAAVAGDITAGRHTECAVPWFWSHQYDLRLQTIGLSIGYDDFVVRGDVGSRSFSIVYLRDRRVIALDCVNAAKDYVQGKALVALSLAVSRAALADKSMALAAHAPGGLNRRAGQ